MTPVPYLTITWKVEDKSLYWRTHTLHLADSDAPVSIAILTDCSTTLDILKNTVHSHAVI
jgi:hypothetical protein